MNCSRAIGRFETGERSTDLGEAKIGRAVQTLHRGRMPNQATNRRAQDAKGVDDFEQEVLAFAEQLRGFVRARISDAADAEDVAQEVFLKAFRARGTLRDPARLNAWLYRTARTAIIDHYRRRRPTDELPAHLAADFAQVDDLGERMRRSVRRFLATLPDTYRRPLELTEFEGMTAAAVAKELALSETAAKSRIARGRAMLREKLTQCCRFEFDSFGKIVDFKQRAPCACGDDYPPDVRFALATEQDEPAIRGLLASVGLPTDDLTSAHFLNFFTARHGGQIIGCAGLEPQEEIALLRSLAVAEAYRGRGVARRLVKEIERLAGQLGMREIFLLTTTARGLFEKRGYAAIERENVPAEIRRAREFAELCPHSAIVLSKRL